LSKKRGSTVVMFNGYLPNVDFEFKKVLKSLNPNSPLFPKYLNTKRTLG
jgi:hypothetical protein